MGKSHSTLFVSDLHLEDSRPEITRLFLSFLQGPARKARALYILGDLFEAWIGDDAPGETGIRVAAGLSELADGGVPVWFMHGNRDFLVGEDYCRRAGMTLIAEPRVIDLYGTPTLITHGDELCTGDVDYQRFRNKVRDPEWQRRMLSRPVWLRKLYARAARLVSRHRTGNKPENIMDVDREAVEQAFRGFGVQRIIHGHTHRPAIHELEIDGATCRRIVLGDWYEQGSVLEVGEAGMDLKNLSTDEHRFLTGSFNRVPSFPRKRE